LSYRSGGVGLGILASLALLFQTPARLKGHALATLLLMQLGMTEASPIFRFIQQHHLIPGLEFFRIMHLYLNFAVIGLAVLGSAGDALVRSVTADPKEAAGPSAPLHRLHLWGGLALAILWIVLLTAIGYSHASPVQYVIPAAALLGGAVLLRFGRSEVLPMLLVGLLVCETAALRVHGFRFFNPAVLDLPLSVAAAEARPGFDRFKVFGEPLYRLYAFLAPRTPHLDVLSRQMLTSMAVICNVIWDLPSIDGSLALPLRRRVAVEPILEDEIAVGPRPARACASSISSACRRQRAPRAGSRS
jgi:hypothetical protein